MAPAPLAGSDIYERILRAPGGLVVLEHVEGKALIEQFRALARVSGKPVYVWRPGIGIENLGEVHGAIPGSQCLTHALRHIQKSNHSGVYLLSSFSLPLTPADGRLLRHLALAPAGPVRRVVLLDAPRELISSLDNRAVRLSGAVQRPKLRDGRWLW